MNLFEYLRRWFNRQPGLAEMPPMPALPLCCPMHERPDVPLTLHERVKFYHLTELYQHLEAAEPGEQP